MTFFGIFFPSGPLRATSFFCLFAETLSQTLTWRHAGTPTLSLSLSLSPSSKCDPGRLYVSFSLVCLEKSQGIERLCRIQARTTALLNQQQAQLTDDRHAWQSAKTPTDPRKIFPGKETSKILAFLEKEVYFWDS